MTTKNAILMIVKQSNGIDYNSLLSKFAASYSNINSGRAALSRSLKDLITFGFLEKKGGRIFLLPKGEAEIYSAVKNKLILGLNAAMRHRKPANDIEPVVEKLQILIERSRQDKDLLKTSKSSLDFTISGLETAKAELEEKAKHLEYLSKVFGDQISSLKEMDFHDSCERQLDGKSAEALSAIFSAMPDAEFTIECRSPQVLQIIAERFNAKPKETSFSLPKALFRDFAEFIGQNREAFSEPPIALFSSSLRAQFRAGRITLFGPFSEIRKWGK
ncbi:Uncharacterised protein [uncultured archaeon]|nr:Uncharacterised protein [uncultured archaeon]